MALTNFVSRYFSHNALFFRPVIALSILIKQLPQEKLGPFFNQGDHEKALVLLLAFLLVEHDRECN